MIRAVIDTNVWVSGLLSVMGPPALVDLTLRGLIIPVVSAATLSELEQVLRRPELALPRREVMAVPAYLRLPGLHVVNVDPEKPERVSVDPDDDIFTAAAVEGEAAYLITGNTRHFPQSPWRGIQIVDPATFLERSGLSADA